MVKNLVVLFAILALAAAFAGTVPVPGGNYRITLTQPSVVKGIELKPGDYRLNLSADKITIDNGKQSVESVVKVETVERKFDSTSIRYNTDAGKQTIVEIRLGGTKTKLSFN
jgi:hypothetical protein